MADGNGHDEKKGFWRFSSMLFEGLQTLILGMLLKGSAQTSGSGGTTTPTSPQQPAEKEVPSWMLYFFGKKFKGEMRKELRMIISSHDDELARDAMDEFVRKVEKDHTANFIGFLRSIISLRREFIEKMRHPAPKDESGRLKCTPINQQDPSLLFMDKILKEEDRGEDDLYERQKAIAVDIGILEEKTASMYIAEHKLLTLAIMLAIVKGYHFILSVLSGALSVLSWIFHLFF